MQRIVWGVVGAAVSVAALAGGYYMARPAYNSDLASPAVVAAANQTIDVKAVEEIVRNYLLENPEIMIEVQAALEERQKDEQRVASSGAIKQAKDEIFNASSDAVFGNPNGKTTIVEFYDYNCGFCKRAFKDMNALISSDPDLRFVLKELPILGPDSQKAHVVSQALHKIAPDKYQAFHNEIIGGSERATEDYAVAVALSLGVDEAKLREAMADPAIAATFERSIQLANHLAVTGTPSYVIGDEVVFGAMGEEVLREKIEAARATCQTAAC